MCSINLNELSVLLVGSSSDVVRGTGVSRYAKQLIEGFNKYTHVNTTLLNSILRVQSLKSINHLFVIPLSTLINAEHYDIIHALTPAAALYSIVLTKIKPLIVTFHETSFLNLKLHGLEYYTITSPLWYKFATFASRIVAVSSLTKIDLIHYLRVPSSKIDIVNPAIDDHFKPLVNPYTKVEFREVNLIGYVGTLGRKKRVDYAILALYELKKKHPELKVKLMLIGKKDSKNYIKLLKLVRRLGLEKNVVFLGPVSESELVKVYNLFDIFVFPSAWEGFGYPILEAQRCGVPVIVMADAHIPPETVRYALKAHSIKDLAEKLYLLLTDQDLRNRIISLGLKYSYRFTLERTITNILKTYEKTLQYY